MAKRVGTRTSPLRSDLELMGAICRVRLVRLTRRSISPPGSYRSDRLVKAVFVGPSLVVLFLATTLMAGMAFGRSDTVESTHALLQAMTLVSFTTVVAGCLTTSLQSLFLSDEVQFLTTLPIPVRLIYFAKFGEVAVGAIPGFIFLLAVCIGYVLGRASAFSFVVLAIPVVLALTVIAIALATIMTAAVVRYSPPRRTKLTLFVTILAILLVTTLIWQRVATPTSSVGAYPSAPETWSLIMLVPPGWTAALLAGIEGERRELALPYLGLMIGALLLVSASAARLFSITYTRNFELTDLARADSTPRRPPKTARLMLRLVPRAYLHWVKREWVLVGRDVSRLSAALWPVVGAGSYALIALVKGLGSDSSDATRFWLSHGPLLLIPWGISMGTAVFSIGAETSALGLIRSMPVRPRMLIVGKYIAYLIPIASLSLSIALIAIAFSPGSPRDNYLLLILVALLAAVFCGIDVGVSAMAPRFGAEHAQQSTRFTARAISLVSSLLAGLLVVLGLGLSPVGRDSLGDALLEANASVLLWLSLLVAGLLLPTMSLRIGTARLARLLVED